MDGSYAPPFLCGFQYFDSSEEIKGHLPEHGVDGILNHPGEPCPRGIVAQMGDSQIPFIGKHFLDGLRSNEKTVNI